MLEVAKGHVPNDALRARVRNFGKLWQFSVQHLRYHDNDNRVVGVPYMLIASCKTWNNISTAITVNK